MSATAMKPGHCVRVTLGDFAGWHGAIVPTGETNWPGQLRVRLTANGETRLFPTDWLEFEVPPVAEATPSRIASPTAAARPIPAPPTGDTNAIWRAVVEAAAATLPEGPNQQVTAWRIAEIALARLEVAPARRWVGTIGDPCWVCNRAHGEHLDGRCPAPSAALDVYLDATVDAARAGHAPKLSLFGTTQLEAFLAWAHRRGFAVTAERRTGRVLDVLHHWDFAEVELSGHGRITVFGDNKPVVTP